MSELTRRYAFRRFVSSSDPDYADALRIYIASVSPDIRTQANQISYWVDRSYAEFGDRFCVCGLYIDRRLVGFAEFAYFSEGGILFLDYLSLDAAYRTHVEYLQFTRMLQDWIDHERLEYNFAVTEITFEGDGKDDPGRRSQLEAQLYKQMGFGVAHCYYRQPPLGLSSPQSDVPAFLMVGGRHPLQLVRHDTMVQIISTVYFKHYLRWYTPFLDAPAAYEQELRSRYQLILSRLEGQENVTINGMELLDPAALQSSLPRVSRRQELALPLLVLFALLGFVSVLLALYRYTQAPWQATAVIIGGSLVAFIAVLSLFHEPARRTLESLLAAIPRASGRRK